MDLNYLYDRRGKALLMADNAACEQSRAAHLGLARGYRDRIADLRGRRAPTQAQAQA